MILVTGAAGNAGSQVVRALREHGAPVRAFVRDAERAQAKLGPDVELALGDFADEASVGAALDGAEAMLLSCADDPRRVEWETRTIDLAAAQGVRRIVKLSTTNAAPGAPVAFWDWHGQVEEQLRASEVPSVILRSSTYMSNLFASAGQIAGQGKLVAPAGEARIAMIDPGDVGDAAAIVLTGSGHDGRTYELTGPAAVTYEDVAAALSEATGRDVRFVDVPDEVARHEMLEAGLPELVVEQVVTVFQQLRQGVAADVTDTFESLSGRPPRSVADFARHHAELFAPRMAGVAGARVG